MSTVVDGTAKLAAKSKPSDKHEAPDLNIEEATVASPRPSRKRAGDFFDFDDGADAEPSSRSAKSKAIKPKYSTKTAPTSKDKELHELEAKPAATAKRGKRGQKAKEEVDGTPSEVTTKAVEKKKRPRKPKVTKDDLGGEKPESSKKSKKATKEIAAEKKNQTDATPKTAKAEAKTKARKSKTEKDGVAQGSSTFAPDVTMNEGPFETVLEPEKGNAAEAAEKQSAIDNQAPKAAKTAKKPAKESKASKIEPAKTSAANVGSAVKKGAKVGTEKAKKAAKSMASTAETPAGATDEVKKDARTGAEKTTKGAKSKDPKPAENDESVSLTQSAEAQNPEASKSRKRKAPASADAGTLKTEILDPLSEHASAKKKQKKSNTKSKSIGDTVGEFLATATEGANAARASFGGLATSIMGGANEAAGGVTGAKKSAKTSVKKAKGKGKTIAEDVTESFGKTAANEGSGNAEPEDDSTDEPDDHTTALLAGFESDGDEGIVLGSGFQPGQKIPPLPQTETTVKKLGDVRIEAHEGPGVVYVGRIPHGFYEHEMREYFSQFGDINRLRLSRSRKSGASKHYAFIEFSSVGVAKIVADTMDNYLMFGHILKCKVIPQEQLHESMWKGANKRFKAVPWNKIEGKKLEMGLSREQWAGRIEGEKKRRASKNEKTKEIGYEFEAGELKAVDQVPVRDAAQKIGNGEKVEEEKSLVTAGGEDGNGTVVVVSEEVKTKRVKKAKEKTEETTTSKALDSAAKKVKRGKGAAA